MFRAVVGKPRRLLDPFAGAGGIFTLQQWLPTTEIVGIEIEPEFADLHPKTQVGNALHTGFPNAYFDCCLTSCVYGNRMSDHHEAKDASRRITYRHAKGSPLHDDNAGMLQWGPQYRFEKE